MNSSDKTVNPALIQVVDDIKRATSACNDTIADESVMISKFDPSNKELIESILKSKNPSPELLLLFWELPEYWAKLLYRFDLPAEMLIKIYDSGDHALKWIMSQKQLPPEILDKFAAENNPDYIFNLAFNDNNYSQFKQCVSSRLEEYKKDKRIFENSKILIAYTDKDFGDCFYDFISGISDAESGFNNITKIFAYDENLPELCRNQKFDVLISEYFVESGEMGICNIKRLLPDISSFICCGDHYFFECLKNISLIDHVYVFPFQISNLHSRLIWTLGNKIQTSRT